jgi:hypothetical protein
LTSSAHIPVWTIGLLDFGARAAVLLSIALAAISATPVLAEMQVRGSPEAVRIDARDAPVEEILAALSRAFGMRYQLLVNLDKRLSGTYVGSLPRVLTRILDGYNFVLKTDDGSLAVKVVGTPYAPGTFPASPASSSAQVVRQQAEATPAAQPARVVRDVARPTSSASMAAPSPAIQLAEEGPSYPTPALPSSGGAPVPVPELRQLSAPPPPAVGSAPVPAPEPRPSTAAPPAGPTPPRAQ